MDLLADIRDVDMQLGLADLWMLIRRASMVDRLHGREKSIADIGFFPKRFYSSLIVLTTQTRNVHGLTESFSACVELGFLTSILLVWSNSIVYIAS